MEKAHFYTELMNTFSRHKVRLHKKEKVLMGYEECRWLKTKRRKKTPIHTARRYSFLSVTSVRRAPSPTEDGLNAITCGLGGREAWW